MLRVLQEVRKLRNLTQEELADRCGCSRALIAHVEAGRRKASSQLQRKLGRVLKVDPRILTATSIDEVRRLIVGSDVRKLMKTPEGRQFLGLIALARLTAGDVTMGEHITYADNLVQAAKAG